MSGFNLSARKDPMSMRLRAQNMKHSQEQTKRLEEDSRKMEERLKELKTAMNREKEERERQGGGFWGRGQTNSGSLTNYASEVLNSRPEKPPKDGKKKKKIKILQEEPLDIPKRSGQPGTMKYIAQRKLTTGQTPRGDKGKGGPKCGQCEDRTASLNCVQCSEIYCPGCFAAFHLKGALKQHRSTPISASGPRVCMSPHPTNEGLSPRGSQASGATFTPRSSRPTNGAEASGPRSPQSPTTLLEGNYDESQSAASFQAALMAWRQGEEPTSPRKPAVVSPVKSPVVTMDESIGTVEDRKVPDIKFKPSLSYAERLLLKKHRRTELGEMHTPPLDSVTSSSSPTASSVDRSDIVSTDRSSHSNVLARDNALRDQREESFIDDGERVNFQSLFEAVVSSGSPDLKVPEPVSSSNLPPHVTRPSDTYIVEEVSLMESWKLEHPDTSSRQSASSTFVLDQSNTTCKSNRSHQSRHQETISELYPSPSLPHDNPSDASIMPPSPDNRLQDNKENLHSSSTFVKANSTLSSKARRTETNKEGQESESVTREDTSAKDVSRPKSSKSRPPSAAAKKQNKSRPGSRAQSRAQSRMGGEGLLTKAPSIGLAMVASLAQNPEFQYQSPMEGFFMVGVEGQDAEVVTQERVLTPSGSRRPSSRPGSRSGAKSSRGEREGIKVSNRLYQMAPRSWRPDSSLGEVVPLEDIKVDDSVTEAEPVLTYTYSRQMQGEPIEWRPSSSLTGINMPNDDLGLRTSQLIGDEMFVEMATATRQEEKAAPAPQIKSALMEPSSTPMRDRLRRKYEMRRKAEEGETSGSSKVTPTVSNIQGSKESFDMTRQSSLHTLTSISQDRSVSRESSDLETRKVSASRQGTNSSLIDTVRARKSHSDNVDVVVRKSSAPKRSGSTTECRPTSSQVAPSMSQTTRQSRNVRPNSSTTSEQPLRRTLPSDPSSWHDDHRQDSILADVMLSRAQADNWMGPEEEEGQGRATTPLAIKSFRKGGVKAKSKRPDSGHFETEVRPFSGRQSVDSSPGDVNVNNRPVSNLSGRESRAIEVEGEDLSSYDHLGEMEEQNQEDSETLHQLEWELASDTGRLTADGQISRLGLATEEMTRGSSASSSQSLVLSSDEFDVGARIRDDERQAQLDGEENQSRCSMVIDEDEVRALR